MKGAVDTKLRDDKPDLERVGVAQITSQQYESSASSQ